GIEASQSNREDSSKCIDANLFMMLRLTAFSKKSFIGKYLGFSIIENVFDKNNSPLRANIHFEYTPTHNGKVPNCTFGKADFKGKVVDFNNNNGIPMKFHANRGNPVTGHSIEISSPEGYIEGNDLPSGEYVFTITSPGYKAYTGRMTIQAGADNDIGTIKLVKEGTGSLTGKITSAMNGNTITEANLTLFDGADIEQTNESTTNKVSFEGDITTNNSGSYNINVANGDYTLKLEKTGYEISYTNVTVSTGNQTNNITLVPSGEIEGTDIGDLRIVLTWGASPSDLDSHLLGPTTNGVRRFHIYYSNKVYNENGKRHAFLDYDDTSSYGPETTTIYNMNTSGKYSFYVQDFSNRNSMFSNALSSSDATVKVYKKESKNNANGEPTYVSKLLATYNIPKNTEGTVWHVFDYNALAEEITPRNTLTYTGNPGDVGTYLLDDKLDDTQINDIKTITNDFEEKIEGEE
ncbi:MAG: carboxypeptidase regulatory-like domain-containing protein, partial [Niameybacter sp.]